MLVRDILGVDPAISHAQGLLIVTHICLAEVKLGQDREEKSRLRYQKEANGVT